MYHLRRVDEVVPPVWSVRSDLELDGGRTGLARMDQRRVVHVALFVGHAVDGDDASPRWCGGVGSGDSGRGDHSELEVYLYRHGLGVFRIGLGFALERESQVFPRTLYLVVLSG